MACGSIGYRTNIGGTPPAAIPNVKNGDVSKWAAAVGAAGEGGMVRNGLQGLQIACVVMVTALVLCGCGRLQDDFRGDTDGGRIQLDVERVEHVSIDEVTQSRLRAGERTYERILQPRLPVGAEVTVSASVARYGLYRRGGGWIFAGDRFLGRHAVWAAVIDASSGSPDSVAVRVEPLLDSPAHNRVVLRAIRPGEARISLTVQPLDSSGQPTADEPVVDTVSIKVQSDGDPVGD